MFDFKKKSNINNVLTAEEVNTSHQSTPRAMIFSVINAIVLGTIFIICMNFCILDLPSLIQATSSNDDDGAGTQQAYTLLWLQTVGFNPTIFFLFITLVAIQCSNCANLTSAARMV